MEKGYFLSGIGTGIGKTISAAALCKHQNWNYWKPIQAGDLENSDSRTLQNLSPKTQVFPEKFQFKMAASPHLAAFHEQIEIQLTDFQLPSSKIPILVEGAGGLLAPISNSKRMVDLAVHLEIPIIIVIDFYLGSLNHSLLTFEYLDSNSIPVHGVVYNRIDANFEWLRKQHTYLELGRIQFDNQQLELISCN